MESILFFCSVHRKQISINGQFRCVQKNKGL